MFTDPLVPMTIGKQQIADYRDYIETFKENLTKTVNAIFDSTTPFEARVNDPAYDGHACTFCRFKAICSPPIKAAPCQDYISMCPIVARSVPIAISTLLLRAHSTPTAMSMP